MCLKVAHAEPWTHGWLMFRHVFIRRCNLSVQTSQYLTLQMQSRGVLDPFWISASQLGAKQMIYCIQSFSFWSLILFSDLAAHISETTFSDSLRSFLLLLGGPPPRPLPLLQCNQLERLSEWQRHKCSDKWGEQRRIWPADRVTATATEQSLHACSHVCAFVHAVQFECKAAILQWLVCAVLCVCLSGDSATPQLVWPWGHAALLLIVALHL